MTPASQPVVCNDTQLTLITAKLEFRDTETWVQRGLSCGVVCNTVSHSSRPGSSPVRDSRVHPSSSKPTVIADCPVVGTMEFEDGHSVAARGADWLNRRVDRLYSLRISRL